MFYQINNVKFEECVADPAQTNQAEGTQTPAPEAQVQAPVTNESADVQPEAAPANGGGSETSVAQVADTGVESAQATAEGTPADAGSDQPSDSTAVDAAAGASADDTGADGAATGGADSAGESGGNVPADGAGGAATGGADSAEESGGNAPAGGAGGAATGGADSAGESGGNVPADGAGDDGADAGGDDAEDAQAPKNWADFDFARNKRESKAKKLFADLVRAKLKVGLKLTKSEAIAAFEKNGQDFSLVERYFSRLYDVKIVLMRAARSKPAAPAAATPAALAAAPAAATPAAPATLTLGVSAASGALAWNPACDGYDETGMPLDLVRLLKEVDAAPVTEVSVCLIIENCQVRTKGANQGRVKQLMFRHQYLDPIILVRLEDGAPALADGAHRLEAARQLGKTTIRAKVIDGTRADAIILNDYYNSTHGQPLKAADRANAYEMRLEADPGFAGMTVPQQARQCMVSERTIQNWRKKLGLGQNKPAQQGAEGMANATTAEPQTSGEGAKTKGSRKAKKLEAQSMVVNNRRPFEDEE